MSGMIGLPSFFYFQNIFRTIEINPYTRNKRTIELEISDFYIKKLSYALISIYHRKF